VVEPVPSAVVETPISGSSRLPVVELVETHKVAVNTFDTRPLPGKQGTQRATTLTRSTREQ
jgi:hypothetical protein